MRERLAIYGKGGGGKSFITTNLSVQFARQGLRTLQIGCDPKHDSTRALTAGVRIQTALDYIERRHTQGDGLPFSVVGGYAGVACVETGGPEPGVGCAGRGIISAFQLFKSGNLLDDYDMVLLDVLGDVVCGGFAAPMQQGFAEKIVIVVSNTVMSMYAANNIARALVRYRRNGVYLAGLVANNLRSPEDEIEMRRFAEALKAPLLACFFHDPQVVAAERRGEPLVAAYPDSRTARAFLPLAERLLDCRAGEGPLPLSEDELEAFFRGLRL